MAAPSQDPSSWRISAVSDSERELAFARAIIKRPDLHEDATLKAACRLLSTVGIATDRRNAELALKLIEAQRRSAKQAAPDPVSPARPLTRLQALPTWATALGLAAALMGITAVALLLN